MIAIGIGGSILEGIKKYFTDPEDTSFDAELIGHINSELSMLTYQLGVGPERGFIITGPEETWDSIYTDKRLAMIEEYVYLQVKLLFDPPANQTLVTVINNSISRLEFRIDVVVRQIEKERITEPAVF